jgi:signal transduction histidine kinase
MVSQDIGRVFLNLFNNACDALQQKQRETPNFSPVLRVTTAAQNGQAVVRIRDNGTGIPPEVRDKIFTPFFTTKPTGTGNTGLGLSISYEIVVKDHDGKLDVQSEPGKFTEFIIALPFKTVHR